MPASGQCLPKTGKTHAQPPQTGRLFGLAEAFCGHWRSSMEQVRAREGNILGRSRIQVTFSQPLTLYVRAAEAGNFGDCEPVGEGVSEMRIHVGPGYRLYYTRRGEVIYLLLVGGDKSEQKRDIKRALEMARKLNEDTK